MRVALRAGGRHAAADAKRNTPAIAASPEGIAQIALGPAMDSIVEPDAEKDAKDKAHTGRSSR
jgi:hypothetical protein